MRPFIARPTISPSGAAGPRGVRPAWRVWLPVVGAGWLATHAVACELVAPHHHASGHEMARSAQGYLDSAPVLLACALTLLPAAAALAVREGRRGSARIVAPPWRLALLPAAGFTVQVHVERLLHGGAPPVGATFAVALTLQLALGVAAVALARGVHALARALRSRLPLRIRPCLTAVLTARKSFPPESPARRSCPLLAAGHAGRAPPPPAVP